MRYYAFAILFTVLGLQGISQEQKQPTEIKSEIETLSIRNIQVLTLNGTINPATALYLLRGLSAPSDMVIIKLNTPGGLLSSTRTIVQAFLDSDKPVVVYVSPSGGQAASAGMFITMAGHIAAMAHATNIGAASPVHMNQGEQSKDTENTKTLARKAMNDTAAFARSVAKERGRNVEWAEKAVREAVSLTAEEALSQNVVDYLAKDIPDLLEQMKGQDLKIRDKVVRLDISDPDVSEYHMAFKEKLLDLISNPNIAYILLMLGFYGIYFELSNPGAIFPGIVGGICIILGFFAMQTLPLNYAGVALVVLGLILFILEIKIPSGGMLSVGAIISFSLGSFMLFDPKAAFPVLRISLEVLIPVVILTSLFFIFAVGLTVKASKRSIQTGDLALVDQFGKTIKRLDPNGQIEIHGEIWRAYTLHPPIEVGEEVKVDQIKGLTLLVSPTTNDKGE